MSLSVTGAGLYKGSKLLPDAGIKIRHVRHVGTGYVQRGGTFHERCLAGRCGPLDANQVKILISGKISVHVIGSAIYLAYSTVVPPAKVAACIMLRREFVRQCRIAN